MNGANRWDISIVSHGHGRQLPQTLKAFYKQLGSTSFTIHLTLNIPEDESFLDQLPQALTERLTVHRNQAPRGFAANHNAAMTGSTAEFILIADPCLDLPQPIFNELESALREPQCGIVSPQAYSPLGAAEDNGRRLITPSELIRRRVLHRTRKAQTLKTKQRSVDWLAGLFLAMRRDTFKALKGFDEGYFLYCEDVDLCLRTRNQGLRVLLLPELRVIHAANRDSHRRWLHFFWHVKSLIRLWLSDAYRTHREN